MFTLLFLLPFELAFTRFTFLLWTWNEIKWLWLISIFGKILAFWFSQQLFPSAFFCCYLQNQSVQLWCSQFQLACHLRNEIWGNLFRFPTGNLQRIWDFVDFIGSTMSSIHTLTVSSTFTKASCYILLQRIANFQLISHHFISFNTVCIGSGSKSFV